MNSKSRRGFGLPLVLTLMVTCLGYGGTSIQTNVVVRHSATTDRVLLEITEQVKGMAPYRGKYTQFRLYQGGRAEYETLERADSASEWRPVKHEKQLGIEDYTEIIRLANNTDFLKARRNYPPLWSGVDVVYITTISFTLKNSLKDITLINYSPDHPRAPKYYPTSVIKLMDKAKYLRN